MKPALDALSRVRRPWKQNIDTPIPWEARTYSFRLTDGAIGVVHEKWVVARDAHGGAVQVSKIAGPPLSDAENPKLTYAQVEAIFKDAEASDDPLRVSYGRVISLENLTASQLEALATCPSIFVHMPQTAVVVNTEDLKNKIEEYKATVSKAAEPISRRTRAHIPPQ